MNIQKIAQELVDEIGKEIKTRQTDLEQLKGAAHGVNLLFEKIMQESVATDEQNSKTTDSEKEKSTK